MKARDPRTQTDRLGQVPKRRNLGPVRREAVRESLMTATSALTTLIAQIQSEIISVNAGLVSKAMEKSVMTSTNVPRKKEIWPQANKLNSTSAQSFLSGLTYHRQYVQIHQARMLTKWEFSAYVDRRLIFCEAGLNQRAHF